MINEMLEQEEQNVPQKEWYVVNTYAGHERRVKENLERRVETMGLQECLFRIVVAEEKEIEYKNGKAIEKIRNPFSGYLFVEMIMTDDAWYVVRNTPGVTGFIGSSGGGAKPFPVAESEMEAILSRLGMSTVIANFEIGDTVEILQEGFANVEGTITNLDNEKQIAYVSFMLLGRENIIDVAYSQLKKIEE